MTTGRSLYLHAIGVVGLAVAVVAAACGGVAAPPPTVSSAQYVRPSVDDHQLTTGEISASPAYLFAQTTPVTTFAEGGAVFRLGGRYDLSVRSRVEATTVEGNLRLFDEPLQIGWLHGVGGLVNLDGLSVGQWTYHATTGLAFQAGVDRRYQPFWALRVAWADGGSGVNERLYTMLSAGYRIGLTSRLDMAPELHFVTDHGSVTHSFAPMISLSAPF